MTDDCYLCGHTLGDALHVHDQGRTGPLTTVACSECSLLQTSPHPTAAEVADYYRSGQYRLEFPALPREELDAELQPTGRMVRPEDDDYAATLDRHGERAARRLIDALGLGAGVRVLEVGCGDGRVAAAMRRLGVDVRAAEYQVAAALARVGQAQAQRRPSFAIGGSLGLSAATLGALGNGSAVLGSLLASVTLPVFDGGASRAQVRVQQAALAQARQSYRAAVLGALQQVEDALAALRGDRLRLARLRLAADAAANAALLARQRYRSGLIDFQTVLDTQRTQYATLDGVVSATGDVSSGQVRLFRALGGGWPAADQPASGGWPAANQPTSGGWPPSLDTPTR